MFGIIPKNLWEKKIPADRQNRIHMVCRSLVIRGKGKVILVDAGIGDKLDEKMRRIYDVEETGSITEKLADVGVTPADVTDVVLTHLHFDHTGGATAFSNGKVGPAFPNAQYYINREQWELAGNPSIRDQSSYIGENYLPILAEGRLLLLDQPEQDLFEGIDLVVSHGHTRGQQHLLVKDSAGGLFFCSDLIPTVAHIPLVWNMAYDNEPLLLLEEKERLLKQAIENGWALFFAHDPVIAAASVRKSGDRIEMDRVLAI